MILYESKQKKYSSSLVGQFLTYNLHRFKFQTYIESFNVLYLKILEAIYVLSLEYEFFGQINLQIRPFFVRLTYFDSFYFFLADFYK